MDDACMVELIALRSKYGYSTFDRAVKAINRRRLEVDNRPKRVHLSPAKRQSLYFAHGGLCHACGEWIDPKSDWQVDHFDPNLSGAEFNAPKNLRPIHPRCNQSKGAKSIAEMAEENHQTVAQYLEANR